MMISQRSSLFWLMNIRRKNPKCSIFYRLTLSLFLTFFNFHQTSENLKKIMKSNFLNRITLFLALKKRTLNIKPNRAPESSFRITSRTPYFWLLTNGHHKLNLIGPSLDLLILWSTALNIVFEYEKDSNMSIFC